MADIAGSYSSNQSYNPKFNYSISYSQTGRSGSAVSYRFNVSFSKQNGWYGYDININWNIGGATGSRQIKSTADVSSGSTSFDVTCSTNASGGTLAAQIWTSSSADGTHWQNKMDTGSRTVNKSTFNTPPSLDGGVTADGTTENKIISENKPSILVSWPAGSDTNNNLSGYRLRVSINGGGYAELTRTSSRSYTHNVSGYGEGSTFRYAVDAYDSYGEWSKTIYSGTITKNIFTPSSFNSSSKISYSDGNSTIVFNVSGGGNTDGSGISRSISCDGLTVYNGNAVEETTTVTVYRTGETPTGPYVRFDDIKNKFASTNYNNSLNFRLTTINNYGNSKYNIKNIGVDLRTNPNPVASCSISTTDSTAYETVSSTGNKYFIPDSGKYITVIWETATGKLGEPITYDLYVSYGGGAWQLVTELLPQESTKYNHYVPKQNASQSIRYKVRTKTLYGYYSDKDTSLETLHYYNSPSLSQGTITRGATTADVIVTIKSNSSIPNINTVGTWNCYDKGTSVSVSNGTLTVSQNAQTLKITGLTDAGQYDLKVTFKDDTGFSNNNIITIAIGANSPLFFVNKYGAGVNGVKANSDYSLLTNGSIGLTVGNLKYPIGLIAYEGDANGAGLAIQSGGTVVVGSGESPKALMGTIPNKNDETLHLTSDTVINFVTNCQTIADRKTATLAANGSLSLPSSLTAYDSITLKMSSDLGLVVTGSTSSNYVEITPKVDSGDYKWGSGLRFKDGSWTIGGHSKIYHQNNKPEAVVTSLSGGVYEGSGDGADSIKANVQIKSWYGIGFAPSSSGYPVPQNQNAAWINVRNGDIGCRGVITELGNKRIVESGKANSGGYVRYSDGTQICWGSKYFGTVAMSNVTSGVYTNTSLGLNGFVVTYAANFVADPYVSASVISNAYSSCQAYSANLTSVYGRIWNSYPGTSENIEFRYIAIGKWY